jgi:hypothetical protein
MPCVSKGYACEISVTYLFCSESIRTLIDHQLANQIAFCVLNARQNLFPRFARVLSKPHLAPVWERLRFLDTNVSLFATNTPV